MPFKDRFKGFTLVELLVVLVIFLVVGTLLFYVLVNALRWVSSGSGEVKQELSVDVNTDLLVFDLKHAGYGISRDESKLVLEFFNGTQYPPSLQTIATAQKIAHDVNASKVLVVRETINVVKKSIPTYGFVLWNGSNVVYSKPSNAASSNFKCSWLSLDGFYNKTDQCNNGIDNLPAIGYPLDNTTACKSPSSEYCCSNCNCTTIIWFLNKLKKFPERCINGTLVLSRQVGSNNKNRISIINCIADWSIWFGIDNNTDGKVEEWINEIPYSGIVENNDDLKNKLKLIKIYMLVQASPAADPRFDICTMTKIDCDKECGKGYIKVDELKDSDETPHKVCLKHPSNDSWKHYRWKIVEITVSGFPNIP